MASKDTRRENVRHQMALSQQEQDEYECNVLGLQFLCHPDVFSPKYFRSSEIFGAGFPFRPNEDFLEIGSGIGVTVVLAAKRHGNRVVAIEINPVAVDVCQKNAIAHGVADRVDVRQGDLFSPLQQDERFDTVFWDFPFVFASEEERLDSTLSGAVFDPGYSNARRFLLGATAHAKPRGRIVVSFGTNGDRSRFNSIADELGFHFREVFQKTIDERGGLMYQLLESEPPDGW